MSEDIVDALRGAAELLLSGPEHVQISSGMLNLHNRADEMRRAADEIVRLRHLVPPIAGTVDAKTGMGFVPWTVAASSPESLGVNRVDGFPALNLEERVAKLEQWKEGFYDV